MTQLAIIADLELQLAEQRQRAENAEFERDVLRKQCDAMAEQLVRLREKLAESQTMP